MAEIGLRQYHEQLKDLLEHEALEEVIGHCRHILQYFPKHVETYCMMGQALLFKNRTVEAMDVFQRILGVMPDDKMAHAGISQVYADRKEWGRAIWHLERAFEQDPNNTAIQQELRNLYTHQQDIEYGKLQLTRGALARMYFRGGLFDKAITELQNALIQHPERVDLRLLLAEALWESAHPVEAAEVAAEVVKALPYCLSANRILAQLWLENGRPSDARPFLARVEDIDPYESLALVGADIPAGEDPFILPRLDWTAAAAQQLATEMPAWMRDIGSVLERPEDVHLAGDQSVPDWLNAAAAPPPQESKASSRRVEDALQFDMADFGGPDFGSQGSMPDWMAEVEQAAQGAPPSRDTLPETGSLDWMADIRRQTPPPAAAPISEMDWSSVSDALGEEPSFDALDLPPVAAGPSASADEDDYGVPSAASALTPDWLADVPGEAPAEELSFETPETPDWFANVQAAALDSAPDSDMNWLAGQSPAEKPLAPAWLQGAAEDLAPAPEPAAVPVEPGERVPTGFTGLLGDLVGEEEDPLAWLSEAGIDRNAPPPPKPDTGPMLTTPLPDLAQDAGAGYGTMAFPADDSGDDPMAWLRAHVGEPPSSEQPPATTPPEAETYDPIGTAAPVSEHDPLAWLYSQEEDTLADAAFEVPLEPSQAAVADDPLGWLYTSTPEAGREEELTMNFSEPEPGDELERPLEEPVPDKPDQDYSPAAPEPAPSEDWLSELGVPGEPEEEAAASADGPVAPAEIPDWLSAAIPADVALSPAEPEPPAPDWLAGPTETAAEVEEAAFGAEMPALPGETPDWVLALGGAPQPVGEEPAPWSGLAMPGPSPVEEAPAEVPAAAEPADDWLSGLGAAPGLDEETDEVPAVPAPAPDWLSAASFEAEEQETGEVPAAAEPADDWLSGISLAEEETSEVPAVSAPASDWLSAASFEPEEQETVEAPAAEPADDWLSGISIAEEETGEVPAAPGQAPDWLSAASFEPEEQETVEAPAAEAQPDAEEDFLAAPGQAPDWLSGMTLQTEPPEAADVADDDWLTGLGAPTPQADESVSPETIAPGTDWLSELSMTTPEIEPQAEEQPPSAGAVQMPDWLSAASFGEETPGEEELPAAESTSDWLSGFGVAVPEPEAEAEAELPGEPGQAPDWLSGMSFEPEEPAAAELPAAEPAAEPGQVPDWLGGMSFEPEETAAAELPAAEPAAEPGQAPDWLSGFGPAVPQADEEISPEAIAPGTGWLSELGMGDAEPEAQAEAELPAAEPGQVPDWLSGGLSFGQEQPEAEEALSAEPALSWLGDLGAAPEPEEEAEDELLAAEPGQVPDWLGGLSFEPDTEAAVAPAAEPTEDWLGDFGATDEEIAVSPEEIAPGTGWLSELSLGDAEPEAQVEDELPAVEPGLVPDWLSAASFGEEESPAVGRTGGLDELAFEADEGAIPEAGAPAANWLSELGEDEGEFEIETAGPQQEIPALPDDAPDWLRMMAGGTEETPEPPAEPAPEVSPTLDFLSGTGPLGVDDLEAVPAPAPEAGDEFDFEEEPAFAEAEPGADWLGELGEPEIPAVSAETAGWLSEMGLPAAEAEPEPEAEAPQPAPRSDLGWLSEIGALEAEPEEGLQPGATLPVSRVTREIGMDWLGGMGALEAETAPLGETQPASETGERYSFGGWKPLWLRGSEEGGASSEEDGSRRQDEDDLKPAWLRKDDLTQDGESTLPDWLKE